MRSHIPTYRESLIFKFKLKRFLSKQRYNHTCLNRLIILNLIKLQNSVKNYSAQQAFPFGFGAKKYRGRGLSVLTAREMKRELLTRTETLATQASKNWPKLRERRKNKFAEIPLVYISQQYWPF